MVRETDKEAVAAHLARMMDRILSNAGTDLLKLFDDARHADCEIELGKAIRSADIVDDVRHFLGPRRMQKLGFDDQG